MKIRVEKLIFYISLLNFILSIHAIWTNTYLSEHFILLGLLFASNCFFTFFNVKFRNLFLNIFNIFFILFYLMHVWLAEFSLSSLDYFIKNSHPDRQHALLIILIEYIIFSFSIVLIKPTLFFKKIYLTNVYIFNISIFCIFILFLSLINPIFGVFHNNLIQILLTIFSHWYVIFFIALFCFASSRSNLQKAALYNLIFLYFIFSIIWGTKAGGFNLFFYCFFIIVLIKRQSIVVDFKSLFKLFIISLILILCSHLSRTIYQSRESENYGIKKPFITNYFNYISQPKSLILADSINRLNYFDLYFKRISDSQFLGSRTAKMSYIKAIIDRLTPGFDLFNNSPYISRIIYMTHNENTKIMGSELLTIFYESYAFFGTAFPVFFISIISLIQYFSNLTKKTGPLSNFIFNLLIIHSFYNLIEGFGLDMLIAETIIKIAGFFLILEIVNRFNKKKFFL